MANVSWEVLTPVATEPITLSDMKTYLRVDYTDEDTLIGQLITRGRRYAEQITRKALAPQVIRATLEPDPITEGTLSGPIGGDFDIYRLNERLTTVPFGFYGPLFQLPWHPVSAVSVVEYQLTPFDNQPASTMQWTTLVTTDTNGFANYLLDTNTIPMAIVLRPLLTSNRYRFTYNAGYNCNVGYSTGSVPDGIIDGIFAWVGFRYDHRQGQAIPDDITNALARERIFTL